MGDFRLIKFLRAAGTLGASSVILAILLFAVSIIEHERDKNVSAYFFAFLAPAFFAVGAYLAWSAERNRADDLENCLEKPDLVTTIDKCYQGMRAVKFDPSSVTKTVKADLRKNVHSLDGIGRKHFKPIYEIALRDLPGRGNLGLFCTELMSMNIEGMTSSRAAEIGLSLNNKAGAIIDREQRASLGITHAIWLYANAACMRDPIHPTDAEIQQDAAHRDANGKQYEIRKGLLVDGKWTWPRVADGCKCFSRSIIPGMEK